MGSERIKNDLREFEQSVRALSDGIGKASDVWNDRKYTELSNSIREVANDSMKFIQIGDRCCSQVDKFMAIAAEKY